MTDRDTTSHDRIDTPSRLSLLEARVAEIERHPALAAVQFYDPTRTVVVPPGAHLTPPAQRTLDAALRRSVRIVDGWQPIETAPRDETPIDIWEAGFSNCRRANVHWVDGYWKIGDRGSRYMHDPKVFTHWQSIPAPPSTAPPPPAADDEAMVRELAELLHGTCCARPNNVTRATFAIHSELAQLWDSTARAALAWMRERRGGG